jgi:hypothetical protein
MVIDALYQTSFKTYINFVSQKTPFVAIRYNNFTIDGDDPKLNCLIRDFLKEASYHAKAHQLEKIPERGSFHISYLLDNRFLFTFIFVKYSIIVCVNDIHTTDTGYEAYEVEWPEITERLLYLIDQDQKKRDTNVYKKVMSVVDDIEKQEKTPETFEDCCLCLDNTNPISFRCRVCKEGLICKSCVKPYKKRFHTCPCCRADRHKKQDK